MESGEQTPQPPVDPLLAPRQPFEPIEFGYHPEWSDEHRQVVEAARGDLTLFLLQESHRNLARLKGTPAAYPDIDERLQSFQDRITFRELFLDGET